MQQAYPRHDEDVIKALHEGARLCGHCLGRKKIRVYLPPDFLGDKPIIYLRPCDNCKGTGLE